MKKKVDKFKNVDQWDTWIGWPIKKQQKEIRMNNEQISNSELEIKLNTGYQKYLNLPKAQSVGLNVETELYKNKWCVVTGKSVIHPHPHRHYTLLEFAYWCGKDERLNDRFLKKRIAKPDTWFKEGTECELMEDCGDIGGIYEGVYVVQDTGYDIYWYDKGHKEGDEVVMREFCQHEEFDVFEAGN